MAKNDYHVIAYRILAYLYLCVKEGAKPDMDQISFSKFEINESYWNYIVQSLFESGYISGFKKVPMVGTDDPGMKAINPKITPLGIEYLEDNSMMAKAKSWLLTAAEIIPGLIR